MVFEKVTILRTTYASVYYYYCGVTVSLTMHSKQNIQRNFDHKE